MAFSLLADEEVDRITELEPQWFLQRRIRLILLDFDNTIVAYTESEPSREFLRWTERLKEAGIGCMIVSNSRKSRRVPDFGEKWSIGYIRKAGKPSPKGLYRAMGEMGCRPEETAMAGDQTFTDILAGNLEGVTSILVRPIRFSNPFQVIRYGIELPFIRMARRKRKRS